MKQRHITKNSIIIQNGGEPEIRKQNYWFAYQCLVTSLSLQNLPPTLSQNQIAITVEDFNESVQAADVEAFTTQERGPHQNCPIMAYLSKRKVFSLVILLSFVRNILDSFDLNWFRVLDKDIGQT